MRSLSKSDFSILKSAHNKQDDEINILIIKSLVQYDEKIPVAREETKDAFSISQLIRIVNKLIDLDYSKGRDFVPGTMKSREEISLAILMSITAIMKYEGLFQAELLLIISKR